GARGADPVGADRVGARPRGCPGRCFDCVGPRSRLTAMHGFLPIFFLLVVLKIPVFGSLWLVWWASREPEPEGVGEEDSDGGFGRPRPMRPRPRGPHPSPIAPLRRRGVEAGV